MVNEFLPNQKNNNFGAQVSIIQAENQFQARKKKPKQKFTSNPNKKLEVDEKGFQSNKKF